MGIGNWELGIGNWEWRIENGLKLQVSKKNYKLLGYFLQNSLLITCYLLLVTHYSLLITHYSLLITQQLTLIHRG
ncbi:MAG: hypothetical protein F6K47_25075 [Symploca sp. SIO2E6]|nr:hypothetical protein [Symploca sp. SIO2E6]